MANTQIYVLDEQHAAGAGGRDGELYIGGAGLARGYLGRAELTAEKFVPHPFSGVEASGCIARETWCAVWRMERSSSWGERIEQVKVRGYRIELGEIEAVLQPACAGAGSVVLVREETHGNKRLVAYVVAQRQESDAELREYLKGAVAGVHGAGGVRDAGDVAADGERQGGSTRRCRQSDARSG